jgi:hypothetical protein
MQLLEPFETCERGTRRHPAVAITEQSNEEGSTTINFPDASAQLEVLPCFFRRHAPLQVNSGYSDIALQCPAVKLWDYALGDCTPFLPEVRKRG